MQELLSKMVGRQLDIVCSGAVTVRGEALQVADGILYLKDEDEQLAYLAIDKIVVIWEARDNEPRAGFVQETGRLGFSPRPRK